MMKAEIKRLISNGEYEKARFMIEQYETDIQDDSEIYLLKSLCSIGLNDIKKAVPEAEQAVKNMPYVANAHYNLGYMYESCGEWLKAYEQYSIAQGLVDGGNLGQFNRDELDHFKNQLLNRISEELNQGTKEELLEKQHFIDYIVIQEDVGWGVRKPLFHDLEREMITSDYMDYPELQKMFLGIRGLPSVIDYAMGIQKNDTITEMTEIQRVSEEKKCFEVVAEHESYLPIIMDKPNSLMFQLEDKQVDVSYVSPLQYVNFRIPKGHTVVNSENAKFRVGEIVPIVHDKKRKKLVLNIFVDGLSQTVLGEDFEKVMPHTYKFFQSGMVCENAYTAGDWTFPSIASITTGQTIANHKMLHSKLLRKIDIDTPILFEYFKNAGYNTTKIGGNWRIAPNYGYARGMNRVFYQHMYEGYTADRVIAETEEQMHRMQETDQFIWMEIGELHLIADELNIAPLQSEFMVWENEALEKKINSVKQNYDPTKRKYYLKQVEYIDRRLASLYQYIEEHYKEDEIVVSLFSDHGQGYLVKQDEDFLSDERTKIAFMMRGNDIKGHTREIMSACDYSPIMCKLAGITYDYTNTDAHLPMAFGGSEEREFSVTESIHVGDPYQIVLNGKDFRFYLNGKENVTSECRVPLDEYETQLTDADGNVIQDNDKTAYYTKWCLKHVSSCVIYKD